MKKVLITWTKWKTSTVELISEYLKNIDNNVLEVNNEFVKIISWKKVAKKINKDVVVKTTTLLPSICPWRFLVLLLENDYDVNYSILETSIWSSIQGIWFKKNDLWLLTNVYKDHIWINGYAENRDELIKVKLELAFWRLKENGYGVIYLNDKQVYESYLKWKSWRNINFLEIIDKNSDLKIYDGIVVDEDNFKLEILNNWKIVDIFDLSNSKITLYSSYIPWLYLSSYLIGFLIAEKLYNKKQIQDFLKDYTFPLELWRLAFLEKEKYDLLVDFAHEEKSLTAIFNLIEGLKKKYNDVYFIFRPSLDLREMGMYVNVFNNSNLNKIYLYDKIDSKIENTVFNYKNLKAWESLSNFLKELKKYEVKPEIIWETEKEDIFKLISKTVWKWNKKDLVVYIHSGIWSFDKEMNLFFKYF